MVKRRGVIMNDKEVYETFDRIERVLKHLRDTETQIERSLLRVRVAQGELGNLKQYIKYEVKKDD